MIKLIVDSTAYIPKDYIEDIVITQALKILTDENIDKIAKIVVKLAEKEKDKTRIKSLERQLKSNEKAKSNLFDSIKYCGIDSVKQSIFEEIAKHRKKCRCSSNSTTNKVLLKEPYQRKYWGH